MRGRKRRPRRPGRCGLCAPGAEAPSLLVPGQSEGRWGPGVHYKGPRALAGDGPALGRLGDQTGGCIAKGSACTCQGHAHPGPGATVRPRPRGLSPCTSTGGGAGGGPVAVPGRVLCHLRPGAVVAVLPLECSGWRPGLRPLGGSSVPLTGLSRGPASQGCRQPGTSLPGLSGVAGASSGPETAGLLGENFLSCQSETGGNCVF